MKLRKCFRCGKTHECVNRVSKLSRVRKKLGTLPKLKPVGTYWRDGHEYLHGVQAHFWRRLEIYRRACGDISLIDGTFENVEDLRTGMCEGCAETHPVGWHEGEWHHDVKTRGGKRCDCVACGLWVCRDFHRRYHNRVVRSGKLGK